MLPVTPNFSEAQDFSPISIGDHVVRAIGVGADRSKKDHGHIYLKWNLEVMDGPEATKTVNLITMTEGKGAGILKNFLEMLNPSFNGGEFDAHKYLNRPFIAVIGHKPSDKNPDQMFAEVKNFKPLPTLPVSAPSFQGDVP